MNPNLKLLRRKHAVLLPGEVEPLASGMQEALASGIEEFHASGMEAHATGMESGPRTRSQKFVRVISVLKRFFVPGSLEVKTLIKQGVGGTKKTKNRSGEQGSHNNADPRKIHEKNEKSE